MTVVAISGGKGRAPILLATALAVSIGSWGSSGRAEPQATDKSSASSSETDQKGRQLFATGRAAYERGDYDVAAAAFQEAYEATHAPRLLFNIAQALRLAGKCVQAVDYYQRYRESGEELPSDFPELQQEAERCASQQQKVPKQAQQPTSDTREAKNARAGAASAPTPFSATQPSDESTELSTAGPRGDTAPDRAASSGWPWTRWAGLSCLTAAVGSGVAATVFTVQATTASEKTSELSKSGGVWDAAAQRNEASGERAEVWAIGLFAATALTGGLGAWLLLQPIETTSHVSLSTGPDRISIGWQQAFQ